MFVHRSNRAEQLVEMLTAVVREPLASPLASECIAVQGRGMERWLAMELSRRLGVWANPDFPFPRRLIERLLVAAEPTADTRLPENENQGTFSPTVLPWAIASTLPRLLPHAPFAPLRRYLEDDLSGARRLQLADRIAATFDQYAVFRPEMVLGWESGQGDDWQALLWRELARDQPAGHVAARAGSFFAAAQRGTLDLSAIPARLSLFGVSTLPPLFLQILYSLSQHVPVHLFVLSPSDEYWAHLRSPREYLRRAAKTRRSAASNPLDPSDRTQETTNDDSGDDGNPLLASLGRVGREFQEVVENSGDYIDEDAYADPGSDSVLHILQSDIRQLRRRGRDGRLAMSPDDPSVRVHACHNPMREIEVLYDQLLDLFAASSETGPHEVLVMSPAIDEYAPFIDAVFGGDGGNVRIPYRIADRAVRQTDQAIAAFLAVLSLCRGRMSAASVLDLLAFEPVRNRFGLVAEEADSIRDWVRDVGIRWGVDAEHRAAVDQPPHGENTWRFGLDRLLLGYAMPGEDHRLFGGVLPFDDIEGSTADLLGRFTDLCETLIEVRRLLQHARPPAAWRDDLGRALDMVIANDRHTAFQHQQIRGTLADLAEQAEVGRFVEEIDLATVQVRLEASLEQRAPGRNFLTGGVTFCAMVPMRSIPFKVIALIGMNDAGFPRVRRPLGFDRIAQHPRPGDRTARDDDRYLFLEALLSARERLLITYVGQSIRDNTEIPPSVVVSELLDAIESSLVIAAPRAEGPSPQLDLFRPRPGSPRAATPREAVVVRHPLQPFSPRYFGADHDPRLFSYSTLYCDGARALAGELREPPPFLPAPLAPAVLEQRELTVDQFTRFFENPPRELLRQRLSLYLGDDQEKLAEREPIELNHLERWQIGDPLLRRGLAGESLDEWLTPVRAAGRLPPGNLGLHLFASVQATAEALVTQGAVFRRGRPPQERIFQRTIGGSQLSGRIDQLFPPYRLICLYSTLSGKQLLRLWLPHLALGACTDDGITSVLISRAKSEALLIAVPPVADAEEILGQLIELYWQGLDQPLPLFAHASHAYAERLVDGEAAALQAARTSLAADLEQDEYARIVFGPIERSTAVLDDTGPLGFRDLARRVYLPLLSHCRTEVEDA